MPPIFCCISCIESSYKIWQTISTRASTVPSWSAPRAGSTSWTAWKWFLITIRWNWPRLLNVSKMLSILLCFLKPVVLNQDVANQKRLRNTFLNYYNINSNITILFIGLLPRSQSVPVKSISESVPSTVELVVDSMRLLRRDLRRGKGPSSSAEARCWWTQRYGGWPVSHRACTLSSSTSYRKRGNLW